MLTMGKLTSASVYRTWGLRPSLKTNVISCPHPRALDHLSPSRVALVPPSSHPWHSDQNLLGKCLHLRTCPPAPGLLTACSLEDSHDISLFAQGMAMTNVDACLSPGSKHCNGTAVAVSFGCGVAATGFPSASTKSFSLFLLSAFTWPDKLQ